MEVLCYGRFRGESLCVVCGGRHISVARAAWWKIFAADETVEGRPPMNDAMDDDNNDLGFRSRCCRHFMPSFQSGRPSTASSATNASRLAARTTGRCLPPRTSRASPKRPRQTTSKLMGCLAAPNASRTTPPPAVTPAEMKLY